MSHPLLRPRVGHLSAPYQFHRAVLYPVGAGDAVYEPAPPVVAAMLPSVSLTGHGVYHGSAPNPNQGPLLWANRTAWIAGIGGPLAGQIFGQPLVDPTDGNGSQ